MSELTEEEYEAHYIRRQDLKGFLWLDAKYLNPFFTRRLTQEVGRRPGVPCLPPSGPAVANSRVGREDPHAGLGGGLSPLSFLSFPASRAGYACGTLHLLFFPPAIFNAGWLVCLFLAALGLHCSARAFSSCDERGLLFVAVRGLLIAVASLVVEHGI